MLSHSDAIGGDHCQMNGLTRRQMTSKTFYSGSEPHLFVLINHIRSFREFHLTKVDNMVLAEYQHIYLSPIVLLISRRTPCRHGRLNTGYPKKMSIKRQNIITNFLPNKVKNAIAISYHTSKDIENIELFSRKVTLM